MREDVDRDEPAVFDLVDADPVDFDVVAFERDAVALDAVVLDAVVLDAVDDERGGAFAADAEGREEADRSEEPDRVEVPRVGTLDRPAMGRGYP